MKSLEHRVMWFLSNLCHHRNECCSLVLALKISSIHFFFHIFFFFLVLFCKYKALVSNMYSVSDFVIGIERLICLFDSFVRFYYWLWMWLWIAKNLSIHAKISVNDISPWNFQLNQQLDRLNFPVKITANNRSIQHILSTIWWHHRNLTREKTSWKMKSF